tara:strand:- start:39 stop:281 length:243 start_codon:yes stop_codon:yes gene_type:complete
MSKDIDKLLKELEGQMKKTEEDLKKVVSENAKLKDEVDSLWGLLDEINESDIENYSHLLEKIEKDAILNKLMTTTKKADC